MISSRRFPFLSERRAALAERAARWARKRQGNDALPLILRARRVYILPTKVGVAAAVLLFVMMLAGMNYENSLALLLCFSLSGLALVSMHECHRTLVGMQISRAVGESTFAGKNGHLLLTLNNDDTRARNALEIRYRSCGGTTFHLEQATTVTIRVTYDADRRGLQRIERLKLWTEAPLGLFQAWSWLYLPLDVIVYPAAEGARALPGLSGNLRHDARQMNAAGDDEWGWLRPYQQSDSPRSVAWKAYARGAPLLVAQYHSLAGTEQLLDFDALLHLNVEQRLSQLARWVLECERREIRYALRLRAIAVPAGLGANHRRICLEALALYEP